jgi:hypothetical protein
MRRALLLGISLSSACAAHAVSVPPMLPVATVSAAAARQCPKGDAQASLGERSDAEILKQLGTGLDAYRLQDGVWLAHAPVLVNEDFDFAVAMSLEGIGAGIAAKKRMDDNAAKAAELAATELPAEAARALSELRACGLHRWGMLWGGKEPTLTIVTDMYDAHGKRVSTEETKVAVVALSASSAWISPGEPGNPSHTGDP